MMKNSGIATSLVQVQERITQAMARSNRDPRTIRLLAVSKTRPILDLEEAYGVGQRDFAENRVQEWLEKSRLLPEDCKWHMVGKIQTNKVKYLDHRVTLIHSLDRLSLMKALNEHGREREITWSTLLQVNIARDPAKAGLAPEEVPDFLDAVGNYSFLQVRGLMTIGALEATPAETKEFFRELRLLRDTLCSQKRPGVELNELSMGMSRDFESAIEEGATLIRVGQQIFGDRGY